MTENDPITLRDALKQDVPAIVTLLGELFALEHARVTLLADRHNPPALEFHHKLGFAGSGMQVLRKRL